VINLGTNAVHALRHRAGRVNFELSAWDADEVLARLLPGAQSKKFLRLAVSDNGAGMDVATRERAFEPFFTTKSPGQGNGLGLSVVHGIVRHHQGAIRIESKINHGTIVEVFLPVSTIELSEKPAVPAEAPTGLGERILIIDDEEIIARTTKLVLRNRGFAVESEISGPDALSRLEGNPHAFDLVISDQTMPVLTGLELARRVRTLRADLPVVLATGHSDMLTQENLREAGVREVLQKPYTAEGLVSLIRRHLPVKHSRKV
jgi:CheY-like chemotaxis protein